jgi:hypothetical protein
LKPRSKRRPVIALLALALLLAALALALGAAQARASDGGMAGMPGMTDAEMQNMTPPTAAATPAANGGSMSDSSSMQAGQAMDPNMDMGGGSINWFVIGGFIVLVVGSTLGAMATKRHLARRMAAGELAGAGALDV